MNRNTPLLLIKYLDDGLRAFTKGFVVKEGWRSLVVHFEDVSVLDVGEEIALYREWKDALIVQNYRVLKKKEMTIQGGVQLKVRRVGEPRPFDQRTCQRCPNVHEMIVAELGGESGCIVVDVGDDTLGIIARSGHSVGDILDLKIDIAFTEFMGSVTVCSVADERWDRNRYGVVCNVAFQKDEMQQFLKRLKMTIQFKSMQTEV